MEEWVPGVAISWLLEDFFQPHFIVLSARPYEGKRASFQAEHQA